MVNNVLKVVLWNEEVGKIYWNHNHGYAVFSYSPDFIKKGLDIAPLTASIYGEHGKGIPVVSTPLRKDDFFKGLPPFLADSLPDKWGNTLFNCWANSKRLDATQMTPVDKLAFIGKRAMGAFEFEPDKYPWNKETDIDLQKLYDLATRIYRMREEVLLMPEDENLLAGLCEVGTSAGGQHSKAVIAINEKTGEIRSGQISLSNEYKYYLLKFAEGTDFPVCNIEMAYYFMAKEAGINMMPSRLIEVDSKSHFITERFDRVNGEKVFTQTLAAIYPKAETYEDLFCVCDKLGISQTAKAEMFRRTVFNLLSGNTDDHVKNFSFMMDKNGKWTITPAYDLTFTVDLNNTAYGKFHSMTLGGKDCDFTIADLCQFAELNTINNPKKIIEEVCQAISGFHSHAKKAGVNQFAIDKIEKFLATILPLEYGKKMNHYLGSIVKPYITDEGCHVEDFRMNESSMHDYELWCIIDGKRYRTIIDGESAIGKEISAKGGNRMSVEDKKSLIKQLLIPKALAK